MRVVPAHGLLIIWMIVIWHLLGGDKGKLVKVDGIEALGVDFSQGLSEALRGLRWQKNLIGIHVNEPIGIERCGERLLALALRAKTKDPCPRQRLDPDQTPSGI